MEEHRSVELLTLLKVLEMYSNQFALGVLPANIDIGKMIQRRDTLLQEFLYPYLSKNNAEKSE